MDVECRGKYAQGANDDDDSQSQPGFDETVSFEFS